MKFATNLSYQIVCSVDDADMVASNDSQLDRDALAEIVVGGSPVIGQHQGGEAGNWT
jgi:hypothetical protein